MKLNDYLKTRDAKVLFFCVVVLIVLSFVSPSGAVCADLSTVAPTGNTSHSVTLNMNVVIGQPVWFEYGLNSGEYAMRTPDYTAPAGVYGEVIDSSILIPGQKYYYRAACENCTGDEMTFNMTSATPVPTTTFSDNFETLADAGWNLSAMFPIVGGVYDNALSDLGAPAGFAYAIMWTFLFVGLWLRQENMMVAAMLFVVLTSAVAFSGFLPGIGMYIGYISLVVSGGAVVYYLLRGR